MGEVMPVQIMLVVRDLLAELIASPAVQSPSDNLDASGRVTQKSSVWQQMEAFSCLMEATTSNLPASQLQGPLPAAPVAQACVETVHVLLAWQS